VKEKSSVRQPSNTKVQDSVKTQVKEEKMAEGISLAEQGAIAKEFLVGLLSSMEILAEVSVKEIDAETVEISINATPPTELGVLVGPRGSTLQALQEVTRTVVQSKSPSRTDRILVDVAQYRERRVAALGRFANQVATEVLETGEERALEPMSAADRKAVHDALSGNSAVVTRSEGEDPRRFVVVAPA
jgi:spoIIIJ-associated protein